MIIVVMTPDCEIRACLGQVAEDRLVAAFIPEAGVEALDEPVLLRLAKSDAMSLDLPFLRPAQESPC